MRNNVTTLNEVSYDFEPRNEKYYGIVFEEEDVKKEHNEMWDTIQEKGMYLRTEFWFDFMVDTYEYNNKYYQLRYNDNYGYRDCIKEYTR
jgi:hypothetical protein